MKYSGFTLAELLIALAILGVIATFTIPKVLQAQGNAEYNAKAKEAAGMVSEAYMMYKLKNTPSDSTKWADLTPYLNYVSIKTDGVTKIDARQTEGTWTCDNTYHCMKLHNGAYFRYHPWGLFPSAETTSALEFYIDPDGKETVAGSTDGPGKSLHFFLYFNGRVRTRGTIEPNTSGDGFVYATPNPSFDPPWFSW